jgi:S-adenosylmethionine-diacylglycerol 3-amino-3-carboxypropyl transferase
MLRLFEGATGEAAGRLFGHPHWPVAFETFFSDRLLETMFGPDATQHATPGSYPAYFRRAFERGLLRDDAADNPFLHHVLLGKYLDRPRSLPHFLTMPVPEYRFELVEERLDGALDLADFDVVDLSNVPDWMKPDDVRTLFGKVGSEMRSGSTVVWRQLNNERDLEGELRGAFVFDAAWQDDMLRRDRSLFYSSIHVGVRS